MHFKPHRRRTCPVAQWMASPWRDVCAAPSVWEAGAWITEPGVGSLGPFPAALSSGSPRPRVLSAARSGPAHAGRALAGGTCPGLSPWGLAETREEAWGPWHPGDTAEPPGSLPRRVSSFHVCPAPRGALASRQRQPFSRRAPSLLVRPDAPGRRVSGHRVLGGMGGANLPPAPRVRVF